MNTDKIGSWREPNKSDWWWCGCTDHAPTLHPASQFICEFCGYTKPESMTIQARLDRIELQLLEIQEAINLTRVPSTQLSDFAILKLRDRLNKFNGPRQ